jgi:hypothetical protein
MGRGAEHDAEQRDVEEGSVRCGAAVDGVVHAKHGDIGREVAAEERREAGVKTLWLEIEPFLTGNSYKIAEPRVSRADTVLLLSGSWTTASRARG